MIRHAGNTTYTMELTKEHIEIMSHTRDRAAGGYYCGDSPEMKELVAAGYMAEAGYKGFCPDPYFILTRQGRQALIESGN